MLNNDLSAESFDESFAGTWKLGFIRAPVFNALWEVSKMLGAVLADSTETSPFGFGS